MHIRGAVAALVGLRSFRYRVASGLEDADRIFDELTNSEKAGKVSKEVSYRLLLDRALSIRELVVVRLPIF
jgi:hypothetical protein